MDGEGRGGLGIPGRGTGRGMRGLGLGGGIERGEDMMERKGALEFGVLGRFFFGLDVFIYGAG